MFEKLTDKLRSPIFESIQMVGRGPFEDPEEKRKRRAQRLFDYYIGDKRQVRKYMLQKMLLTFKQESIEQMQLLWFNVTGKIINRLSLAYLLPAERYVVVPQLSETVDGKTTFKDDPKFADSHANYQELLNGSNINAQAKVWNRLAKLQDTVLVEPVWRKDHIDFDIFPAHLVSVVPDEENFLIPKEVRYKRVGVDGNEYDYFWSAKEHWEKDESGKKPPELNQWNGVNKYGLVPFVPLRLRETEDFWGEGDTQLVDMNEKINILVTSGYHNAIMQSHGQMVTINMKLQPNSKTGPGWIIAANPEVPDQPADVKYISPDPAIEEVMKKCDWLIKMEAMERGLPADSVSIEAKAQSGAAKAIDNFELRECREDQVEFLRLFEKELFRVARVVWNVNNPTKKIRDDAEFGIDFIEPEIPASPLDEINMKAKKFELGLWTPIDDIIDEDENIDRDKAKEIWHRNLEDRNEANDEFGVLPGLKLLNDPNDPNNQDTNPDGTPMDKNQMPDKNSMDKQKGMM